MKKRILAALVLAASSTSFFAYGVVVGVYRIWPWEIVYPIGHQINDVRLGRTDAPQEAPAAAKENPVTATPAAPDAPAPPTPTHVSRPLTSGVLNTDLTIVNANSHIAGDGGTLADFDGKIFIARDNSGIVHMYDPDAKELRPTAIILPNTNKNAAPAKDESGNEVRYSYKHRYNGLAFFEANGTPYVATSYSYYNTASNCITSRLSAAPVVKGVAGYSSGDWNLVFESSPCLPYLDEAGTVVDSAQAAGRLIYHNGQLYMTIGDHGFDGNHLNPPMPQRPDSDYGSIISVDASDWSVRTVSKGHRNQQGIAIDGSGSIWSTEQGPMGGDELNLISEGKDYGWPTVTLGVDYTAYETDAKAWKPNPRQGHHDGFEKPIFAWIPSIAPSGLTIVENFHPYWDGDFIVPTLRGQSLHRLRMIDNRVVMDEEIPVGRRVRDVKAADGRIYILFDDGKVAYLSPRDTSEQVAAEAPNDNLALLQDAGCMQCHSAPDAPKLPGIVGNDIASQLGVSYTQALLDKQGEWDTENLKAFLADPPAFAPGTSMPSLSLSEGQVNQLVEALTATEPQPSQ